MRNTGVRAVLKYDAVAEGRGIDNKMEDHSSLVEEYNEKARGQSKTQRA